MENLEEKINNSVRRISALNAGMDALIEHETLKYQANELLLIQRDEIQKLSGLLEKKK